MSFRMRQVPASHHTKFQRQGADANKNLSHESCHIHNTSLWCEITIYKRNWLAAAYSASRGQQKPSLGGFDGRGGCVSRRLLLEQALTPRMQKHQHSHALTSTCRLILLLARSAALQPGAAWGSTAPLVLHHACWLCIGQGGS